MNTPTPVTPKPTCQNGECKNTAQNTGRRKDNSIIYRRRTQEDGSKIYVCGGCHSRYYQELTGAGWSWGTRDGGSREYMKHRKTYCENRDGRLGHVCTATIYHPKQLCVDHVLENFSKHDKDSPEDKDKNEAHNLQTLCHNCHNWKNHLVVIKDISTLSTMMEHHFKTVGTEYTKQKVVRRVNTMLRNAGKLSKLPPRTKKVRTGNAAVRRR